MKKVTFVGLIDKRPVRESVYVDDEVSVPYFIVHPNTGATLKRVGKVESFDGKVPKDALLIREFTKDELAEIAKKEAESIMDDLVKNPDSYENANKLKKLPISHWEKEAAKAFKAAGKVVINND